MTSIKRNVFITGGASGIGFGIAEHLANLGHQITIADLNSDAANAAAERINEMYGAASASALAIDITDQKAINELPQRLADNPVDVLVNNAGLQHISRIEEFPVEKWRTLTDVMLTAPAMLTKAFLPSMRERNYGRIINVGSIHSVVASPFKSAYVAAKHGLLGFAKTVALETGDCDVTINTLCPAYVKTPLVEKQIAAQAQQHGMTETEVINNIFLEPMPKKSFISIDELAATSEFLMSAAARNITAQQIIIDGGWTAR